MVLLFSDNDASKLISKFEITDWFYYDGHVNDELLSLPLKNCWHAIYL